MFSLTFGLPAPIDVQINGNKLDVSQGIAREVLGIGSVLLIPHPVSAEELRTISFKEAVGEL